METIEYRKPSIRDWLAEERPREKMQSKGQNAMTDAELLAILLGSGTKEENAIEISRSMIARFGSLSSLAKASTSELKKQKGIGEAKAITIAAAFELGRRKEQDQVKLEKITSSQIAAQYLIPKLCDFQHEVFYVLFLSRNNSIKSEKLISVGGVTATVIDLRIVFKEAIEQLASGIIVAHNHPSGTLYPSESDIKVTEKLKYTGTILEIPLIDHIIVGGGGYYSFADSGWPGTLNS
jgi:DNA repair protein RadC